MARQGIVFARWDSAIAFAHWIAGGGRDERGQDGVASGAVAGYVSDAMLT